MSKDALENLLEEGRTLGSNGKYAEACDAFERAMHYAETSWGHEAPEVVFPMVCLAMATGDPKAGGYERIDQVLELEHRALRIVEANFGKEHPRFASVVQRTAITFWELGRYNEARARLEKALQIASNVYGDVLYTAYLLGTLADLLLDMAQPKEALPLWERSLHIEEKHGQGSVGLMHALIGVGRCLRAVGRGTEAVSQFERALAIRIARTPVGYKGEDHIARELREWIATVRGAL